MIHDTRSQFCGKWTKIAQNCVNDREMGGKMCEEEKTDENLCDNKQGWIDGLHL